MVMPDILDRNRVILSHFDSYSAALLFARFGNSVLAPTPLPEAASDMPAPDGASQHHTPAAVLNALTAKYGIDPAQLRLDEDFDAWLSSASGPIRIHLARFTTFEAPGEAIAPHGGAFKPISQMRGLPTTELNLLRQVFNLIMG